MSDIVIDEDYLRTTATDLENISTDLADLCSQLRGADALAVGAAPLFDELHEFAGAWSGCAEDLSEYAQSGAEYLHKIIQAFDEVDLALAEVFVQQERESHDG